MSSSRNSLRQRWWLWDTHAAQPYRLVVGSTGGVLGKQLFINQRRNLSLKIIKQNVLLEDSYKLVVVLLDWFDQKKGKKREKEDVKGEGDRETDTQ